MRLKPKGKPAYGMGACLAFMMRMAWRNCRMLLVLAALYIALTVSTSMAQLFIAPVVLDRVETHAPLSALLYAIGGFSLALLLLQAATGYVKQNMFHTRFEVRSAIICEINRKAFATSYPNTHDAAVLRMLDDALEHCSDNSRPAEHIWLTLGELMIAVLGFALYMAVLSGLSLPVILVVCLTAALSVMAGRRVQAWDVRHEEERSAINKLTYYIAAKAEDRKAAKDIRIFGLGPWLQDIHRAACGTAEALIARRERLYAMTCAADALLLVARNAVAYAYLIHLMLQRGLPASQFVLYFTAFTGFSQWVTQIMNQGLELRRECIGISRILQYIRLPEPFRFEGGVPVPEADGYELRMENVTFRYPGADRDIIKNMNLTLHPGEKVAIVGLNGAGKTTLVRLLCGFYDPTAGRVLLNGQDIRTFNRQEYYALISAVFQEVSQLDLTMAEQVAQRIEGIDMDRVRTCIEKAGLASRVQKLPQGLDTHIGKQVYLDGVDLSGGEMQRLMLARALYKDGAILMLDEPTAALDPLAEHDIYMKYSEMTAGRTSVFISHRLASTRFCDRILFLKDGVIAEEGTHEQLIARGGEYAKLFDVQAHYYREGGDGHEQQ